MLKEIVVTSAALGAVFAGAGDAGAQWYTASVSRDAPQCKIRVVNHDMNDAQTQVVDGGTAALTIPYGQNTVRYGYYVSCDKPAAMDVRVDGDIVAHDVILTHGDEWYPINTPTEKGRGLQFIFAPSLSREGIAAGSLEVDDPGAIIVNFAPLKPIAYQPALPSYRDKGSTRGGPTSKSIGPTCDTADCRSGVTGLQGEALSGYTSSDREADWSRASAISTVKFRLGWVRPKAPDSEVYSIHPGGKQMPGRFPN